MPFPVSGAVPGRAGAAGFHLPAQGTPPAPPASGAPGFIPGVAEPGFAWPAVPGGT